MLKKEIIPLENTVKRKRIRKINRMNWFDYLNYIILSIFALITLYTFYYILIGSFNNGLDYTAGGVYLWPRKFSLENYIIVFSDKRLYHAYFITILRVIIGTVTGILFTSLVAYGMSRSELKFRKFFTWANLFTMFFGGGLIPTFMIMKALGLFDNFMVYIIPYLYNVYNMIIFSSFFRGIPAELRESAVLDGANEYLIWWKLILPLSKPVLATVSLWSALGHWNAFFDTHIYTINQDLQTIQYYLYQIINQSNLPDVGTIPLPPDIAANISPQTVNFAAIIVTTLPIMFVYPFIAKHFTKGVMVGSLKG